MTNILTVSDFFSGGGLETQITGQVRTLRNKNIRFYLATNSGQSELANSLFDDCLFHVPMINATPKQILSSIKNINEFIKKYEIEVIHAHPFSSLVIGMACAHLNNIKIVGTLHGPASFFSAEETMIGFLVKNTFLNNQDTVITVSPETSLLAKATGKCKPIILPNATHVPKIKPLLNDINKPWAWFGRLDNEKIIGLINLIQFIVKNKIAKLHIYGDGPALDQLKDTIEELDPDREIITLEGWTSNTKSEMQKYSVIAGMGRVIIEAAASNKLCLLVGYDGIKKFLTPTIAKQASIWNFSGRGYQNTTELQLCDQWDSINRIPSQYSLYEWIKDNHNEIHVWEQYLELLNNKNKYNSNLMGEFINVLEYLGDSEVCIWEDNDSLQILKSIAQNIT